MSKNSFVAAAVLAALAVLVWAQPTPSSYIWEPAVQVTDTEHDIIGKTNAAWGTRDSVFIHHLLREFLPGDQWIGWYINADSAAEFGDSTLWEERKELLTGEWGLGESLRGDDFRIIVDDDDVVHVFHEIFNHPNFQLASPGIGYKRRGHASWRSDTAIVITDSLNAGRLTQARRDVTPRPHLQRADGDTTLHVTWHYWALSDTTYSYYNAYSKKPLNAPDDDWELETFITRDYASINWENQMLRTKGGARQLIVDQDDKVHLWGRQEIEAYGIFSTEPDTVRWHHVWGTPPGSGEGPVWTDVSTQTLAEYLKGGREPPEGDSGGDEGCGTIIEGDAYLYVTWPAVNGPTFIQRLDPTNNYSREASELQLSHGTRNAKIDDQLYRSEDGTWHYVCAVQPSPGGRYEIWHRYVTTNDDPYEAALYGTWSEPSMVSVDSDLGPQDSQRAGFVAEGTSAWITYTLADTTDRNPDGQWEMWFREGRLLSDAVQTGSTAIWKGLVSLDADFSVAEDGTLIVNPGTMVIAADTTDRLRTGLDPNRVELIVQGIIKVEGDSTNPVVFRGTDTTLAESNWGGIVLEYEQSPMGYGYKESTGTLDWAHIQDAKHGITLRKQTAPRIRDVAFARNDSGDIYVDGTDVVIPYNLPEDSTKIPDPEVGWRLLAPTDVRMSGSVDSASSINWPDTLVDIHSWGRMYALGTAGDSVKFQPAVAASRWNGIYLDWTSAGSQFLYTDIGHAEYPLFMYWPVWSPTTIVENSTIHHFGDVAVWVQGASALSISDNKIERGEGLDVQLGNEGIRLDRCRQAIVDGNVISLAGANNASGGAGIQLMNSKSFCAAPPPTVRTVDVANNTLVGPGTLASGMWHGIEGQRACAPGNQEVKIRGNHISKWNGAGIYLVQSSDFEVSCNVLDSVVVGLEYTGTLQSEGPVTFRHNDLELPGLGQTEVDAARTDDAARMDLGPASNGRNKIVLLSDDYYIVENDTDSSDTLSAQRNYWMRSGVHHVDADAADSVVFFSNSDVADSVRIDATNKLSSDPLNPDPCYQVPPGALAQGREGLLEDAERGEGLQKILGQIPLRTELLTPGPSPFREWTKIPFTLAGSHSRRVHVEVFDVTGRRVSTVLDAAVEPGSYLVSWYGKGDGGGHLASGVYFIRMRADDYTKVRKVVILR